MTFEPIKNQTIILGDNNVKVILYYNNGKFIVLDEVKKFNISYNRRDVSVIELTSLGLVPSLFRAKEKIDSIKIIGKGYYIPVEDYNPSSYVWNIPCEMTMISFDVYADFDQDGLGTESTFTLEGYIY